MPEQVEAADPLLADDTRIGDFRIRGLLGEGAMGQVYLAQDLTLGRRVALKLIKRSAMEGDAVERFLEEARATASFNHPHIVTLHAVGEHEGRPYLALEYLDGESLRTRLAAGPLPMREALRYARAIAEAIAEAHRHGLVHGDLKPENVVIPRDGRVRVVDFGLAKHAGSAGASDAGTPAYMAPERWRGAMPTGAMDVWSFGILLHELLAGRRPLSDMVLAQLAFGSGPIDLWKFPDAPWVPLVRACLEFEPAARPTADELVRRLTALLDPRAATAEGEDRCPFPGLAAFTREDAADYFGRRAELDALVEQLRTRALVPIVGPSGIGKSSFIRAALLPRLDETERWIALALRPGASPFEGLAAVLALPERPAAAIAESLRRYPDSLSLFLTEVAKHHGARVLLFIDQFEETFTLASEPAAAIAFCDCLARAAVPAEPWRIVLTLRDDFLGRLAAAPSMRPHLGSVMLLGPLAPADLRAAVAGPLANAEYEPDTPELIARIVDDVAGQPACLPLLQFTCQSLWERRDRQGRRILTAEYEAMGRATGALATHAQRFMAELAPDEVRVVRQILLALIHPDGTRRPRLRAELLETLPEGVRGVADRLLDRLLDRRLVVTTRDAERDAATLEVAHEALATAWPQLARWLDETYEERVIVAEIEQASQLWQRRGRRDDETWGGGALDEVVRKVDQWNITLPSTSRAFLDASVQRARLLQRRRRWRIGGIIGGLAALAITAGIAAWAFARKEAHARRQGEELQRAAADLGELRLELEPFDWDPVGQRKIVPKELPLLRWQVYGTASNNPQEIGLNNKYDESSLRRRRFPRWELRSQESSGQGSWVLLEEVQVRSGPAFLVVDRGSDCALSILYLKRLPGFSDGVTKLMQIAVPTCQASRVGMRPIPAGEFYRSVQWTVEVKGEDKGKDEVENRDVPKYEPGYSIDETEVTRGAFGVFDSMQDLTGMRRALSDFFDSEWGSSPSLPVSGINHATARAYCRYLGKDLPSSAQWQKAFRGGLMIDGKPNDFPRRLLPWTSTQNPRPTNLALSGDGKGKPAPVRSFPEDVSPYGVYDLAGNVSEWSLDRSTETPSFYHVHGGNWSWPPQEKREQIDHTNMRPPETIDYGFGVRCVSTP